VAGVNSDPYRAGELLRQVCVRNVYMYIYIYISHIQYMCMCRCTCLATLLVNYSALKVGVKLDPLRAGELLRQVCVCGMCMYV